MGAHPKIGWRSLPSLSTLLASLDTDPVRRGREFERIVRWYFENDPVYRGQLRRVLPDDEWRRSRDIGIDLMAEAHDGGLWAIQAKAYGAQYRVKKADIDSFLSVSASSKVTCRLVVATTRSGLGPNAQAALREQPVPVRFLALTDLEAADLDWPSSPAALLPRRPPHKTPRAHQALAIDAVVRGFERSARGTLVMACGTGKTLVGLWVAERLGAERTLVLVPSLTLLKQVLREWTHNSLHPFPYIAVCSDEGVVDPDALVGHIADLGIPVTTDPQKIVAFLSEAGRRLIFATYHSSDAIAQAMSTRTFAAFDLVVADEAHRCAGVVGGPFTTVLDDQRIRAARRLFMTATPRYVTERVRREAAGVEREIVSMDDEARFGPVLHRLSFGQAIAEALLTDYQVVVLGVEDAECKRHLERGTLLGMGGAKTTDARTLAAQIAVLKAMRKYGLRRMVSYHSRVSAARSFSRTLEGVRALVSQAERPHEPVAAEHVSGAMPVSERERALAVLRRGADVRHILVTNARCLTEGIDVPALDGVAFVEPRRSVVDIVQAVGRAIRLSEDKTVATVLIPVYVEGGRDAVEQIESSAFAPVWDVVRALRAHDEQLAERLDALRRGLGGRSPLALTLPSKLRIDLPEHIGPEFAERLVLQVVTETTSTWEEWFGLLERFVAREGHVRVGQHHTEEGRPLGHWVSAQRARYADGSLLTARAERIGSLPGWTWNAHYTDWERGMRSLRAFVAREGSARPPAKERDGSFRLGAWVLNKRSLHRMGRLSTARASELESLPGWTWNTDEADWERAFSALADFVRREGHAAVPQEQREGALRLGLWVNVQRTRYARGQLSAERERRLAALPGWAWKAFEQRWEQGFRVLTHFADREGHAQIPIAHVEDGIPLGRWVADQRERHAARALKPERVARLEGVRGWTWVRPDERWDGSFRALRTFVARFGHSRVPVDYRADGRDLASWIAGQRKSFAAGELSEERSAALAALPGWTWRPFDARWDEGFLALRSFVAREGHAVVPQAHREDGFPLGRWVGVQRKTHARGRMPTERVTRLEGLPGWQWSRP